MVNDIVVLAYDVVFMVVDALVLANDAVLEQTELAAVGYDGAANGLEISRVATDNDAMANELEDMANGNGLAVINDAAAVVAVIFMAVDIVVLDAVAVVERIVNVAMELAISITVVEI